MSSSSPSVPRDPAAYMPALHFAERVKDNYDEHRRHLDGDIIDGCIEDGALTQFHAHACHFEKSFGGVTYRLVANPANGVIVSGYPTSIRTEEASQSGRWTASQIEDIQAFLADDPDERDLR